MDKMTMLEFFESLILLDSGFLVVSIMSNLRLTTILHLALFVYCPAKFHLIRIGGIVSYLIQGESISRSCQSFIDCLLAHVIS